VVDARRTDRRSAWRHRLLIAACNFYPPFLGAGIRVRLAPQGGGAIAVRMRLRFWNRNAVGTHFGGSLYSMCDPWFMLILRHKLGGAYVVWDKRAGIRFRRPGRGTVSAVFRITDEEADAIRGRADQGETVEPEMSAEVIDEGGNVVAAVEKLLYVRRKNLVNPGPAG
jgi:hypothetical protein